MVSERIGYALILTLMLLLPLSGLVARRMALGRLAVMALAWVGIFGIGLLLVALVGSDGVVGRGVHRLVDGPGQDIVGRVIRVPMAADGHFYVEARVDKARCRMLVDSGATLTALSIGTARAAGLDPAADRFGMTIETANGTVTARHVAIGTLTIGPLTTHDLGAAVSPAFGDSDVLGMNFLSRLHGWRVEGSTLILEQVV